MNIRNLKNLMVTGVLLIPLLAFSAFDVVDNIATSIRGGNSREVARHFDNNVEITILDRESSYSKVQAEMVLRDFFGKNPVQGFDLKHRGNSEGSTYGIGILRTSTQSYRVYYYVKMRGSQWLLQEIRFEKQK